MRTLLILTGAIFCAVHAHAASCPISAGASSTTIVSTIQGCSSPNVATFAAGTYSLAQTVNVPCGVSITGPTVAGGIYATGDGYKHWGYTPTATINWTGAGGSGTARVFNFGSCTAKHSLTYIEVNSNQPSPDGGQAVYHGAVSGNVTIYGNYFHGNQASTGGSNFGDALIFFDGNAGSAPDPNVTIEWNRLGASGDCGNIMELDVDEGGACVGIGFHTNANNLTIENNTTYFQEQGQKFFEGTPYPSGGMYQCLTCVVMYNDWSNIHRIDFEEQVNAPSSSSSPTVSLIVRYNSIHDPHTPTAASYGLSIANGCQNTSPSQGGCVANTDYNVIIDNVPTSAGAPFIGLGIEQWGSTGTTADGNLVQGEWSNSIDIAKDGAVSDSNNLIQSSFGAGGSNNSSLCYPGYAGAFGWWAVEDSPVNTPSGSGNTCDFFDGSVQTSVTPTISPGSTSFTTGVTVTLTNPGTGRDTNTGIWCTTDGSSPTPGTGTAAYYASGSTLAFSVTTTLKCVGMWGAANQPTTYPTGPLSGTFGYQPSAVVSATYTAGTPPQLNSVTLAASGGVTTISPGATIQINATCHHSNGINSSCNTADAYGNAVTSWNSSNTSYLTINGSGLATGVAVGSSTVTATAAGVASNPGITVTVEPTAPVTLSSVTITGSPASIVAGSTGQAALTCYYSDGSTTNCTSTDDRGNGPSSFSSSATKIATISSTGLYTGVATGTTNLTAVVAGITSSPAFGLTVTAAGPTLMGGYLGTPGNASTMVVGRTLQFGAYCIYSNGVTTNCSVADIYGNAVTTWTSSVPAAVTIGQVGSANAGLATAVGAGTPYILAQVGSIALNKWNLTVSAPAVTLTSLSLATSDGVMGMLVGTTNQLLATCRYSDGSTTNCRTTDSHGNVAGGYKSSNPAHAKVNSKTGLITGVATGATSFTATAGGVTSPGTAVTVLAIPPGTYKFTLSGPVNITGTITF